MAWGISCRNLWGVGGDVNRFVAGACKSGGKHHVLVYVEELNSGLTQTKDKQMQLVQINMFGAADEVVAEFNTVESQAMQGKPFNMDEWGKSIGGQWEQVQAALKAAEAAKAGAQ